MRDGPRMRTFGVEALSRAGGDPQLGAAVAARARHNAAAAKLVMPVGAGINFIITVSLQYMYGYGRVRRVHLCDTVVNTCTILIMLIHVLLI